MKKLFHQYILLLLFFFVSSVHSQELSFEDLLIQKELNPSSYIEAKKVAINQELPVSIKLPEGILIDVLKTINGNVFYSVIKNASHPFLDGEILTFDQISGKYDLSNAEINWGIPSIEISQNRSDTKLLLIPDWTNDNVLSFDPVTGDLINANYIPPNPGNLASPKHALLNPSGFVGVSDQITDLVQKFDTTGAYIGIFAPAGGVNNAILDNIRGHAYRPNGNLVVTVGSGANQNAIPEFDIGGNYLGNFIPTGLGGLNSPFCILYRTSDILITGSSSDAAHRYDYNGAYLDNLITGVQFPQQIIELPNGNLALAVFSTPSGLGVYTATGNQLHFFTAVTGLRSVYLLPGGTYLVTNATGLHEIDSTNGSLIRTIYSSANLQYISLVDYSIIPVELTSFTAELSGKDVVLNWSTATETNNSGFAVERSLDNNNFEQIGFVPGFGTTTEMKSYSFTDISPGDGKHFYRLRQIDYNGSVEYSQVVEIDILLPARFRLEQNYPNPFNPTTTINFSIPDNELVNLKVYDVMGNEVAFLLNEEKEAGNHSIEFNASSLASGTYFYKLQAGKNIETRKMLLLK
jgi:Secretion system C-terminal sorting domain